MEYVVSAAAGRSTHRRAAGYGRAEHDDLQPVHAVHQQQGQLAAAALLLRRPRQTEEGRLPACHRQRGRVEREAGGRRPVERDVLRALQRVTDAQTASPRLPGFHAAEVDAWRPSEVLQVEHLFLLLVFILGVLFPRGTGGVLHRDLEALDRRAVEPRAAPTGRLVEGVVQVRHPVTSTRSQPGEGRVDS